MNNNGNLPATPSGVLQDGHNCGEYPLHTGLSKREQFAMSAMQGLLVNMGRNGIDSVREVALHAVCAADSLLEMLDREK